MKKKINLIKSVFAANDLTAQKNREIFKQAKILALNLISSPGSGKTTLLEKTMHALLPRQKSAIIVGDLQTCRDAQRLAPYAENTVQINTRTSCHLYANQITAALKNLKLSAVDFLFIENVGNMVCPGEFDLGENIKVILLSTPEGDDKVAKYPTIFRAADIVLLTKIDLLKIVKFKRRRFYDDLSKINSKLKVIELSALTNKGMQEWLYWLKQKRINSIGTTAKFIDV